MVDGALLLVDSFEGPMPQTKFVLRKALDMGLKIVVVINKIDRPDARALEVIDEVLDLFIELGADDEQLDFPVVYASARRGVATADLKEEGKNFIPLFKAVLKHIPCPQGSRRDCNSWLPALLRPLHWPPGGSKINRGTIVNASRLLL